MKTTSSWLTLPTCTYVAHARGQGVRTRTPLVPWGMACHAAASGFTLHGSGSGSVGRVLGGGRSWGLPFVRRNSAAHICCSPPASASPAAGRQLSPCSRAGATAGRSRCECMGMHPQWEDAAVAALLAGLESGGRICGHVFPMQRCSAAVKKCCAPPSGAWAYSASFSTLGGLAPPP